ncbi:MinD/ParA family protein [Lentibacillus salinarum]|uniref:MinD/ParA family protein n=1 Tax=Lentibacillus salinarum TaxID=446820 RepID=A0ABW3ZQM3_9BACI
MERDQAAKLRTQLESNRTMQPARTIAIASGKGGVGKSNVALNFSLELLNHGQKVLLFDLDIGMGNLDILLGAAPEATIVDMLSDHLRIHDIMETGPRGLAYVAAGSTLNDFFRLEQDQKEYFFQQYEELTHLYNYIIFDMGAGASEDMLAFVMAADECLVVTTPEPTSITDAYGLIKHIVHSRPKMPVSVMMNRSASMKSGQKALIRFHRVIMQFLGREIRMLGILPEDKAVMSAVIRQTPYVLLNDKAAVSKAMKKIARHYLADRSKLTNDKMSESFVQKLKKMMVGDFL